MIVMEGAGSEMHVVGEICEEMDIKRNVMSIK